LNFNNRDSEIARRSNLGNSLAVATENFLSESKLVNLQDRKAFKKLEQEIALAEMSGTGNYKGPVSADYAISGDVSLADFQHKFISSKPSYNPQTGALTMSPAKNKYTATFTGNVKIYELPSLNVTEVIPITGKKVRMDDAVVNRSWLINSKIDTTTMKKEDHDLIRKAAVVALERNKHVLKNVFSSLRRGYILEKRSNGKKVIFKVSLGNRSGLKLGQKVNVYSREEVENPITEEVTIEQMQLGEAVVTNKITDRYAWILVKDKNLAARLKIGDYVTVVFNKDFWNNLTLTYED